MSGVIVIGGGVSGLAAAWRLRLLQPNLQITVLEAAAQIGGKLISLSRDGCLVEGAADGFLARKPPVMDWVTQLGIQDSLVEPQPAHRSSQVWLDGQLHNLPPGLSGLVPADPRSLAQSSLLTPEGSQRAVVEPEIPPRLAGDEESMAAFLTRRYGSEAFGRLMEPLLTGIYAGDAHRLSATATLGNLVALERSGKSLTQGLAEQVQSGGSATPGNQATTGGQPKPGSPAFRSFAAGMASLPQALALRLGELGVAIITGQGAQSVEVNKNGDGFLVRGSRHSWPAQAIIIALPPRQAAPLLAELNPAQSRVLADWPVSSVANLHLAFGSDHLPLLPSGSGFVATRTGAMRVSAVTYSSQKWPGRAPEGQTLLRLYFGGARDPDAWKLPEEQMLAQARELLRPFGGGQAFQPLWHQVFRWPEAFAQPNVGHEQRHQALAVASIPGVALAGGYFAGPGIPDCLSRAEFAAQSIYAFLSQEKARS